MERDLDRFVEELRHLERQRQGQAVLTGASPDDLRLDSIPRILLVTWQSEGMLAGITRVVFCCSCSLALISSPISYRA